MSTVTRGYAVPISSGEIHTTDPDRIVDIEQRHRAVGELLEANGYDGLLLEHPANIAWMTSGGDCSRSGSSETTAALFVTGSARVVVTNNVDSAQLFDRALPGLGFQLKERPWQEPRTALIEDLCRGRRMASDSGAGHTTDISSLLRNLRLPLSEFDVEKLRALGRLVAHAVEATARGCRHRDAEMDVAGELSHRLIRHGVIPERIQVWADMQALRYPHWSYGPDKIENFCAITAVGRKEGLCIGASRTVCFGQIPDVLRKAYQRATLIQATGMYFSQPNWPIADTWNRVQRIYEKFGFPDEWQKTDQAAVTGYHATEIPVVPKSEYRLVPRTPVYWHPSVGPSVTGDTILVTEEGHELLTPLEDWPRLKIRVKSETVTRPDILVREI